ncbi:MAG TPA: hypothetical protein VFB79_07425 [Candidatus Angelobacter sp.]|nr:hypothetical protein [Candidatus Angelobacter sp.]
MAIQDTFKIAEQVFKTHLPVLENQGFLYKTSTVGIVTSGSEIISGVKSLYDSWHIACREAKNNDDLKRVGAAFADAVAKIGVNGVLLALDAKGAKRLSRAHTVGRAYSEHPTVKNDNLPSMVRGSNLEKPVLQRTLQPGDTFEMWVRDNGQPGMHATPPGTDPNTLGINTAGRHLETYQITSPLNVTESTAADFPDGKISGVGGTGGGQQYILPPNWQSSVQRMGP